MLTGNMRVFSENVVTTLMRCLEKWCICNLMIHQPGLNYQHLKTVV